MGGVPKLSWSVGELSIFISIYVHIKSDWKCNSLVNWLITEPWAQHNGKSSGLAGVRSLGSSPAHWPLNLSFLATPSKFFHIALSASLSHQNYSGPWLAHVNGS